VGENQKHPFQLSFNRSLRVDFQESRVTSDRGLVLVRELDERLGFSDLIARHLTDSRAKNTQLPLADLLRQSIYSRMAGYEDVKDAERLAQDPTFRLIGSEKIWERGGALTSRLRSFETELLTQEGNLAGPAAINRELLTKWEPSTLHGGWCWTWTRLRFRFMANRNTAPTTGISRPPAITPCCCSTARATVWRRSCGRATCIVCRGLGRAAIAGD
jgi:Transposase DDE domain group 1